MARNGVVGHDPSSPSDEPDPVDPIDVVAVPITAPGSAPRELTISPPAPAESTGAADPTVLRGDGRASGPDSTKTGAVDTTRRFDDATPRPEEPTARYGAPTPRFDDETVARPGHIVGHDRLADVVTTFGSTLESLRASQGRAPRHNLPTGSGTNQKRIAQVVQATPIDAGRVVELIRADAACVPLLVLDTGQPAVGRGDVVFPGRLRMPGGTRRRVDLRIYPTASGNLTVLELLPRRSWMPQTRRYLRAGVPAITALSDAIEAAAQQ